MPAAAARTVKPAHADLPDARAAQAESLGLIETRVAIAAGLAGLAAMIVPIVWFLASMAADMSHLRAEFPPGAGGELRTNIEAIKGRLDQLEARDD